MPDTQTLFDKIWSTHSIQTRQDGATLLHIDRHLVHDGSSNAFRVLAERNLPLRRPDRTFATPDHYVATSGRGLSAINKPNRRSMVEDLEAHARTSA
jgi:3-isopropylmalate/(R)-2-methylmalate dehydratase large subunit